MKKYGFILFVAAFIFAVVSCDDDDCSCSGEIYGKWEVEEFMSIESVVYPKDNDYEPVIEFKNDGTIEIQLVVNYCSGEFELGADSTINIDNAGCTEACCDSPFSQKFIETLPRCGSYTIDGDELKLHVSGWGWIELEYVSD